MSMSGDMAGNCGPAEKVKIDGRVIVLESPVGMAVDCSWFVEACDSVVDSACGEDDESCCGFSRCSLRGAAGGELLACLSSSSLSKMAGVPSARSVAHCRTFQPSPSPNPRFSRSKKCNKSSMASWYPACFACAWSEAALLYRLVTERAAALKACRSCSGGWEYDVELGRDVLSDLIESIVEVQVYSMWCVEEMESLRSNIRCPPRGRQWPEVEMKRRL